MKWTSEDESLLADLYAEGMVGQEAAGRLGRSVDSTIKKAGRMGLSCPIVVVPPPPAENGKRQELIAQLQQKIQSHNVPVVEYLGKSALFGVISDPHYGSLCERPDLVRKAYEIMHAEGVKDVYLVGDFCEGSGMRKGHEYELVIVGADKQVAHAHEVHPEIKGMTTYFIIGGHDLSFFRGAGCNIAEKLAARKDLVSLSGETTALVALKVDGTTLNMRLEHPGKGSAYALSYQSQKYLDALPGGRKPHIVLIGHYHKAFFMPCYRNVATIQAGCLQSQTDWMRERNLAAHLGFWIVEVRAANGGLGRIKAEFTPFYEL